MDRLPYDATTEAEVRQYFTTRALQLASRKYVWLGNVDQPQEGVFLTHFYHTERGYTAFYVLASHRGRGLATKAVHFTQKPIITVEDCRVADFLTKAGADFVKEPGLYDTSEYSLVEQMYASNRAKRSQVFLMNHIDEGLVLLDMIGASDEARRGYCLHPLLQNDVDLQANFDNVAESTSPRTIALAMDYRSFANAWLSDKVTINSDGLMPYYELNGKPTPGPLSEVRDMLIADKVQNYKDFILYHRTTHPRRLNLERYFHEWIIALGVANQFDRWYRELCAITFTTPATYTPIGSL